MFGERVRALDLVVVAIVERVRLERFLVVRSKRPVHVRRQYRVHVPNIDRLSEMRTAHVLLDAFYGSVFDLVRGGVAAGVGFSQSQLAVHIRRRRYAVDVGNNDDHADVLVLFVVRRGGYFVRRLRGGRAVSRISRSVVNVAAQCVRAKEIAVGNFNVNETVELFDLKMISICGCV